MIALAEPALASRTLDPFGIELRAEGRKRSIGSLDVAVLKRAVDEHGIVVLRGFETLPDKADFIRFARSFGDLLEWNFGHVLDLLVHEDARNYLFTRGPVPYHWDGAFASATPSLQLFQCLRSPGEGAGGETTFCDTAKVIRTASAEARRAWEKISIRYRTEKVAHYGGAIEQRLVDVHPTKGVPVLRFAEPVNDLNPLTLEVDGLEGETQEEFLAGFASRLYGDDVLYAHEWREGDFLLADNHLLIHGRHAFTKDAPRHIQRIHIL